MKTSSITASALILASVFCPLERSCALTPGEAPPARLLRVSLATPTQEEESNAESPPKIHLYGGRRAMLRLHITGQGPLEISASLWARSGEVLAPLHASIPLGEWRGEPFWDVGVELPPVTVKTELLIRLSTDDKRFQAPIAAVVYPGNLAAPLRSWRPEGGIGIFGKSAPLRALFQKHQIPFSDLGEALPARPPEGMFMVGEAEPRTLEEWVRRLPSGAVGRLIAFTPQPGELASLHSGTVEKLHITKVTLPLLQHIDSDDPRALALLIQILTSPSPFPTSGL